MRTVLAVVLAFATAGCVAVQKAASGPPQPSRATECREYCSAIDMRLTAVVIIMGKAGCVCEPKDVSARAAGQGGAAAAGGAAIVVAAQQQQQQQQQQQRQHQQQRRIR